MAIDWDKAYQSIGAKNEEPKQGGIDWDKAYTSLEEESAQTTEEKVSVEKPKTPLSQSRYNLAGQSIIPRYQEDNPLAAIGKDIVNYGLGTVGRIFGAPQQALMQGTRAAANVVQGKPQDFSQMSFGKDILGAKEENLLTTAIAMGLDPATYIGGGILDDLSRAGQFGKGAVKGTAENLAANVATGQRAAKGITPSAQTATRGYLNAEKNALKKDAIKTPDIIFSGEKAGQTTDNLNRLALPAGKPQNPPLMLAEGSKLALPSRATSKIEVGPAAQKAKQLNPADIYVDQYGHAATSPDVFPTKQLRLPAPKAKMPTDYHGYTPEEIIQLKNELLAEKEQLIDNHANWLKSTMSKGVQQGNLLRDELGDVVGRQGRISNNEKWYQDWARENNYKQISNAELRQIAEKQLKEGFDALDGSVPPDDSFLGINRILNEVNARVSKLEPDKFVSKRNIESPTRITPLEAKRLKLDPKNLGRPIPSGEYGKAGGTDIINQIQPRANATGLEPNIYARSKGQIEKPSLPLQRKIPLNNQPDYSLGKGRIDDINAPLAGKRLLQKEAAQPQFTVNTSTGAKIADTTKFTDDKGQTLAKALQGDETYENITKNLEGVNVKSDPVIKDVAPMIKDKSGFTLNLKDTYRNMRDAFGRAFPHIKKNYLDPLDASKGAYVDEVKKYTDDIYDNVVKKLGINKNSKESAAVQWFGEKKRIAGVEKTIDPQTGRKLNKAAEVPYTLDDLKKDFPDKWQNIVKADEIFRKTYNELIDKVNVTVKQIYPTNADKIVPKRTDYYRHFNEMAQGFEGLKNIFDTPAQIDPRLAGISEFVKPKTKWASFKQKRGMGAYKADAVGGFLDYIQPAAYSIHIDPHISKFRGLAKDIAEATVDTKNANNTIKWLNDFANSLAGKTGKYDRVLQEDLPGGRKLFKVLNWANSRIKANQVLGNARSMLAQTANIPAGIARIKSPDALIKGIGDTLAGAIGKGNKAINQSIFIKERYMHDLTSRFNKNLLDQPMKFAAWMMGNADQLGTKMIWNSAYRKFEGAAGAVKQADDLTRSIVAGRGIGEVPLIQQSKNFQLVAPFQLEVANLWHVMGDMVKEKDFGGLALLLLGNYLFNEVAENTTGNRVVFDPINAMVDALSEEDMTPLKMAGRLTGEALSNIPLGQTIATAFPETAEDIKTPLGNINLSRKSLFGREDPTRFGSGLLIVKGIQDPLYKLLPPFGGAQAKKTIEGLTSFNKGMMEKKGEMRFPIAKTPENLAKSALFGQYSTQEAKEYFKKNRRKLSEKQTQQVMSSENPKSAYERLMSIRKIDTVKAKIKDIRTDKKLSENEREQKLTRLYRQWDELRSNAN